MNNLRGGKRIAGTFLIPAIRRHRAVGGGSNNKVMIRMNNNNKIMPLNKNYNNVTIRMATTTTTTSTTTTAESMTTTTTTAAKASVASNNNNTEDGGLSTGGKLFFGGLCLGTFGLGCWQIQRLQEKQNAIEIRSKELAMDPTNDWSSTKTPFRRRVVRGAFVYDKEVLVGPRGAPPGVQLPRRGLSSNKKSSSGSGSGGMAPGPQGYHVLTPLQVSLKNPDGTHKKEKYIWINRGWVPKTMVVENINNNKSGGASPSSNDLQQQQKLLDWNRPQGKVTVMTILSELEKPKFVAPEHDYSKKPLQLFWLDEVALKAIISEAGTTPDDDEPVTYMTQVVANNAQDDDDNDDVDETQQQFPLVPPVNAMAEFKTSPMIHVGYATTWYGLSAAGVYMTRKLITRGRG